MWIQRCRDLEAKSVGIVEVDAVDDFVVDGAEHVDIVLDEPFAPLVDRLLGVDLEGKVLEDVIGRMWCGRLRRQLGRLEERHRRAIGHPEERVEIGDGIESSRTALTRSMPSSSR